MSYTKKHILLIEDEPWLAELYSDVLSDISGCVVTKVRTANEALSSLDQQLPDLIILDMFLPDHNGIEFIHEIASYEDSSQIPIIILSAVHKHDFAMSDERWRHYGVVDCLYKPEVKPNQLASRVKQQLLSMVGV